MDSKHVSENNTIAVCENKRSQSMLGDNGSYKLRSLLSVFLE